MSMLRIPRACRLLSACQKRHQLSVEPLSIPLPSTPPPSNRPLSTSCPINYRTSPSLLASSPPIHEPSALYVVGGLYGNLQALQFIENLTSSHSSPPTVIYNGDFHFFDKRPKTFDSVQRSIVDSESVLATAGNVEKEMASLDSTSCGCDYPEYTDFKVTERSDAIVGRLKVRTSR